MQTIIRSLRAAEQGILQDYLYLAIHQPDPQTPIPRSILAEPALAAYTQGWGQPDDHCLVAVEDDSIVGAVWVRILAGAVRGYGNIDPTTPEFSIAVLPTHRGRGIGTLLMQKMIEHLIEQGYARASLSVQKSNPALRLYEQLGFRPVAQTRTDVTMALDLTAGTLAP